MAAGIPPPFLRELDASLLRFLRPPMLFLNFVLPQLKQNIIQEPSHPPSLTPAKEGGLKIFNITPLRCISPMNVLKSCQSLISRIKIKQTDHIVVMDKGQHVL